MKMGSPAYGWPSSHRMLRVTMTRSGLWWLRKHCGAHPGQQELVLGSSGTGAEGSVRVTATSPPDVGGLANGQGQIGRGLLTFCARCYSVPRRFVCFVLFWWGLEQGLYFLPGPGGISGMERSGALRAGKQSPVGPPARALVSADGTIGLTGVWALQSQDRAL